MEIVYPLLNVDCGVPEAFDSVYDIRELLKATYYLNDKKPLDQMKPPIPKFALKGTLKKVQGTWLEELLRMLSSLSSSKFFNKNSW